MVLYLAGLKGCRPRAGRGREGRRRHAWQRFWHITMPAARGVNAVVLAVIVIDSLRSFDIVWAMTRGGPYNSSELLSTYMFQHAFKSLHLGYALRPRRRDLRARHHLHHHLPSPRLPGGGLTCQRHSSRPPSRVTRRPGNPEVPERCCSTV